MKLDLWTPENKVIGRNCRILVNGDDVSLYCMEASEEDGYAVVAVLGPEDAASGLLPRFIYEYGSPYGCRTRMLRGEVRIELREEARELARDLYQARRAQEERTDGAPASAA